MILVIKQRCDEGHPVSSCTKIHYIGDLLKVLTSCLSGEEVLKATTEVHSRVCGAHQSGSKLYFRIKRMGYYWLTMIKNCSEYAKKCESCQLHANFIHQPPEPLHPTVVLCPFDGA
ncbi:UNVERIFIED_CONTAM: hypothetical protein Slati_2760900 [Sesamum latifolium]|uniref:Integrase zinc-binding domain-containing protein n=1 Tax=Sesamum latifolium TaxID=2727402 RepID=A0AAW2W0L7_9LAMI